MERQQREQKINEDLIWIILIKCCCSAPWFVNAAFKALLNPSGGSEPFVDTVRVYSSLHVYPKRGQFKLGVMDTSAEVPTQEDILPLRFKVLPMEQSCKGQAPSLWHHYFLSCLEQEGLHVVTPALGGLNRGWERRGCPACFPMFSPANENTGRQHIPISSAWWHGDPRKSVSKYQRQGHKAGRGDSGACQCVCAGGGGTLRPHSSAPALMWKQHLLPSNWACIRWSH